MVHPNRTSRVCISIKEELDELALSIEKDGLLQPILVREDAEGYEIVPASVVGRLPNLLV